MSTPILPTLSPSLTPLPSTSTSIAPNLTVPAAVTVATSSEAPATIAPARVKMATEISSFEELDKLTHLNGLSIRDIIEPRARPGRDSNCGFIGAKENFIDVLKTDWAAVAKEGMTHIQIARHLEALVVACKREASVSGIVSSQRQAAQLIEEGDESSVRMARSFECYAKQRQKIGDELAERMKEFSYAIDHQGKTTAYRIQYLDYQIQKSLKERENTPLNERMAPLAPDAFSDLQKQFNEQSIIVQRAAGRVMKLLQERRSKQVGGAFIREILSKEGVDPNSCDKKLKEDAVQKHFRENKEAHSKFMNLKTDFENAIRAHKQAEKEQEEAGILYSTLYKNFNQAQAAKITYEIEAASKSEVQVIFVEAVQMMGTQVDLFRTQDDYTGGWSNSYIITNAVTRESLEVSGGSIDYIRRFGFYEGGGARNPYRIDPRQVICILTGRPFRDSSDPFLMPCMF